ncbi:NAD-dependent epimerase/dehydratase family protein [Wenyingzhuangia sp. IMCC45533]
MILVTGGTGLVGAHLLYKLCATNNKIVAIYRNEDNQKTTFDIFNLYGDTSLYHRIIWRKADVTNIPELEIAFEDITHVYHAAAMVSFNTKDHHQLRKINIEGTANIVNLCIENRIQKLCYVSSIATLAEKPGQKLIDESCDWNPEGDHSDYSLSKFGAEMEVWRGSQEGLEVVIVNPGVIFGFGNWKYNTSKLFVKIKKGFSYYTEGVTGVVGVKDVVNAMVMLMNSSVSGERFILVSDNMNYKNILSLIANKLGVPAPSKKASKYVTEIAWRVNILLKWISFKTIDMGISKYSTKSAHKKKYYEGSKIKESIDFNYTPFDITVENIASKLS